MTETETQFSMACWSGSKELLLHTETVHLDKACHHHHWSEAYHHTWTAAWHSPGLAPRSTRGCCYSGQHHRTSVSCLCSGSPNCRSLRPHSSTTDHCPRSDHCSCASTASHHRRLRSAYHPGFTAVAGHPSHRCTSCYYSSAVVYLVSTFEDDLLVSIFSKCFIAFERKVCVLFIDY